MVIPSKIRAQQVVSANGPFNTEIATRVIMNFVATNVFPVKKEIQEFSLEVASYSQGFWNSFLRHELGSLEKRYRELNQKFLTTYHTFDTPDELLKETNDQLKDNQNLMGLVMADYMQIDNMVQKQFDECFRMLSVISRDLSRYSQATDQRVATILSMAAISVSVIVAIFK
jgi:hypothetical protein